MLRRLTAGELTEDEALAEIRRIQLDELGGRARLDLGRHLRRGLPEVVLALGKEPEDAARLAIALAERHGQGLVSRMSPAHRQTLQAAAARAGLEVIPYHASARVVQPGFTPEPAGGRVGILTAGTSDLPAADEARMVVEASGHEARLEADLGVAGLHRFVGPLSALLDWGADVLIVAAGMDGVLPGLVGGLIDAPVIGLPVSSGYGRGGAGEGALNTMLQSCSTGLVVVNIDNGVGAGAGASLIAGRAAQGRRRRGLSTASTASTIPPASSSPNRKAARPREKSTPVGTEKASASTRTAAPTPISSQGAPRRRRP